MLGADHRFLAVVVYLEQSSKQRASRVIERPRSRPPQAPHHPAFDRVLGSDPELLRAKSLAARFAATPLPVVLLSETGTGKELFARAIHEASPRAAGPFVAMNCGAVPESLLESELFGFAPGAFTGAARRGSEGKLAAADGGTLFLDEIAETSSGFQAALLRALDDGSYFRVGESRARHVSLRLVCATCRDLPDLVHSGKFRSDLFYRIHGACLRLPALRDRTDRVELSRALLAAAAKEQGRSAPALADDAVSWLESHTWPGNVRELKSALCHALALCDGSTLRREHFPEPLAPASRTVEVEGHTREEILEEAVRQALDASSGNVSAAARMLGVARSTVYRILRTRQ